MFASSTQMKYWTHSGTTELKRLRTEANQKYAQTTDKTVIMKTNLNNHAKKWFKNRF